jgi:elongation factor P
MALLGPASAPSVFGRKSPCRTNPADMGYTAVRVSSAGYLVGSHQAYFALKEIYRPMASTADFKNGLVLVIDGQLWQIIEFQHVKPGKGPAFVRTKLKNVLSGKVVDKTYNAGVKVETATVDRRDTTYLYRDGTDFVFMDSQDYEQHPLPESLVGDDSRFLLEGLPVQVAFHNGAPLYLELPVTVELVVTHTEPGLQGDRSSAGTKPATVETGAELQVPLFINTGDKLKVDSRDGSYLGRVNA